MTRVNVVDPAELTDTHLNAELREITRIFTQVEKHGCNHKKIVADYTLGTGHVVFFTDKLSYIYKRAIQLHNECLERGRNSNFRVDEWEQRYVKFPQLLKNDYVPTEAAKKINRERIAERIQTNPKLYTYCGEKLYV